LIKCVKISIIALALLICTICTWVIWWSDSIWHVVKVYVWIHFRNAFLIINCSSSRIKISLVRITRWLVWTRQVGVVSTRTHVMKILLTVRNMMRLLELSVLALWFLIRVSFIYLTSICSWCLSVLVRLTLEVLLRRQVVLEILHLFKHLLVLAIHVYLILHFHWLQLIALNQIIHLFSQFFTISNSCVLKFILIEKLQQIGRWF